MSNLSFTSTTVELSVPNFAVAKEFYTKLQFHVVWEEPAKEMNGYMVMQFEQNILCFFCGNEFVYKHPYFKQFPQATVRGYGVELSIPVAKIDEYYEKIQDAIPGKSIFQPLQKQPWGKKDFRVIDPFGYFLRFNEPWNVLEYLPLETDYIE
jgi:uncharacterized glyoxalase superfamily protein PhnB